MMALIVWRFRSSAVCIETKDFWVITLLNSWERTLVLSCLESFWESSLLWQSHTDVVQEFIKFLCTT